MKTKKLKKPKKKRIDQLDEDVPTVNNAETIREYEERTGHGFWGNSTTGYVKDKYLKRYGYEI